jgi:hypothetical protein
LTLRARVLRAIEKLQTMAISQGETVMRSAHDIFVRAYFARRKKPRHKTHPPHNGFD